VRIASPALIYVALSYHRAMFDAADAPDPERVYANHLKTCAMSGIEPVPSERALGLMRIPAKLTAESDDVDRVVSCGAWSSDFSAVGHHRCQFSGLESRCTTAGQPGRPASA
jgi:hypothetical protein